MIGFNSLKANFDATDWAWHDIQDRSEFNAERVNTAASVSTISLSRIPSVDGSFVMAGYSDKTGASAGLYVGGVLAPNGHIYFIPFSCGVYVLKLDPRFNDVEVFADVISTDSSNSKYVGGTDQLFWGGVLGPNGIIYCIPYSADYVLKIDTNTDTISRIPTEITTSNYADTTTTKWCGGVLAPNGIIYCAPYNAGYILKIDTKDDSLSVMMDGDTKIDVDSSSSDYYSGNASNCYQGAVLGPNGKIYFIPYNATYIAEIDPYTDTVKMCTNYPINTSNAGISTYKFSGGVLAPDGYIYMIPCRANKVLKFDATKDTIVGIETVAVNFHTTNTTYYKYCGGVLGPNGNIYFVPLDSNTSTTSDTYKHSPYVLSTKNGTLNEEFGSYTLSQYKWRGGVLAPNGKIYYAPFDVASVLVISPAPTTNTNFGLATLLSPYLNKF